MKCERCGAELVEGIDSCINCGFDNSKLDSTEEKNENKGGELMYTPQVPSVIEVTDEDEGETTKKHDFKKWILPIVSIVVAVVVIVMCFYASAIMNSGAQMLSGGNDPSGFGMMQIFGSVSYTGFAVVFSGLSLFVKAFGVVAAYFIICSGFNRK